MRRAACIMRLMRHEYMPQAWYGMAWHGMAWHGYTDTALRRICRGHGMAWHRYAWAAMASSYMDGDCIVIHGRHYGVYEAGEVIHGRHYDVYAAVMAWHGIVIQMRRYGDGRVPCVCEYHEYASIMSMRVS